MYRRRRKRNNSLKFFVLSAVIVGAVLFFAYQQNQLSGESFSYSNVPSAIATTSEPWTQTDYSLRRKLNFTSTTTAVVTYNFDHQELVDANQSQADGSDLAVIAQAGSQAYTIPYVLTAVNTAHASIKFDTSKYSTATYFLYFNDKQPNLKPTTDPTLQSQTGTPITASDDQQPQISLQPTKYWVLLYKAGAQMQASLKIDSSIWQSGDQLYYVRAGDQKLNQVQITNVWTNPVNLNLGQLPTGSQGVFLVVQHNGQFYRGPTVYSMVSAPVFVAWTIDWDDKSILDSYLTSINKIANQFQIPLTQFFNPRIYIDTTLSSLRRGQITNWVKARELINHDELALHLHMYTDLVQAAGVTPHNDPHWGNGTDGYGALTTNYSAAEMTKILKWSMDELASNGLPKPTGFRAGGWYADLDTLKALNDSGFAYDSSGRETYAFPPDQPEAAQPGPWHLDHTTQPYQPSTTNQNSPAPAPNFNLWEMPDNGNDSYWFSADDLISRFYANYTPGEILTQAKLVTYLSHPDWFDTDQPKLIKLFLETDKFSYAKDKGPLVYTTMSNALKEWQ